MLPERVAEQLGDQVRLNWKLRSLRQQGDTYRLEFSTPAGPRVLESKTVVMSIPAHAAAEILADVVPEAATALGSIKYAKVACLYTAYPKSAVRQLEHGFAPAQGFGHLIPRHQGLRSIGAIYTSSQFPGRCPEDEVLLTNFIGGARDPALYGGLEGLSAEDLISHVHQDLLKTFLKPDAPQPNVVDIMVWDRAIPQPGVGHAEGLTTVTRSLADAGMGGMFLAANYVEDVSVAGCIETGGKVGAQAIAFLDGRVSKGSPRQVAAPSS